MSTKVTWENRIARHGVERPDQLLANPRNHRIHPKHQQDTLRAVLDEVGWVQDVIVNERTGTIVDGHLRVSLALQESEDQIPVAYVHLTDHEEALVLATFDSITGLAGLDQEKLDDLLSEISYDNEFIDSFLSDLANAEGLGEGGPPSLDDLADIHEEPEESDFWPVIKIKVSPDDHARYRAIISDLPGSSEDERFVALLDLVQDLSGDR